MGYEGPHAFKVSIGGTGDTSLTTYSVVCGGTTSTAALQSVSGVGSSTQVLTSNGAGTLPTWQAGPGGSGITGVNVQVFTGSGTYTPTAGMVYCTMEAVGGGGAGGGSTGGNYIGGGGGGAGGYVRKTFSSATIGASQTVTIGSGGTGVSNANGNNGTATTLGALISAGGGNGGVVGTTVAADNAGGTGGTCSGGDINLTGMQGGSGMGFGAVAGERCAGGYGGGSFFGQGGPYIWFGDQTGINGTGFGSGGSGSTSIISNQAGGSGTAGIMVITEYT